MKNLLEKKLKKKTTTLYRYRDSGQLGAAGHGHPTVGQTDPTNTTITVLTTVSGYFHLKQR